MRKLVILCAAIVSFASLAAAQGPAGNPPPDARLSAVTEAIPPAAPRPQVMSAGEFPRWQLAVSYEYFRFRTKAGSVSMNGVNTSVAYFVRDWLGIEGNVAPAFGNLNPKFREKFLFYGGGPHIVLDRKSEFRPWVHALFGGTHLTTTQAVGPSSLNGYGIVTGGGVDIHLKDGFWVRGGGDYVVSHFSSSWQNSFQIKAGIVINF